MISWLRHLIGWFISVFRSREDLILENLALRQQLLALRARRPRRRVSALQKLFWIVLRRLWAGWKKPLILVTPRTVVGWHRGGAPVLAAHLERLMAEYVRYYHEDRTHLGLAKDTPAGRLSADRPVMETSIRSFPRLGGLHHRYALAA